MTKETKETKTVYQAIAAVQGEVAKHGISKDRKNAQQGYNFRGIDDVYNVLAPLLSAHGLCILPRVMSRYVTERVNKSGTSLFYVTVEVEFDFVSAADGSKHTVKTYGEAMDSGDKATNKALSASYKYACLQTFCIPTEGENDADATTHEVQAKSVFESPALRQMFLDNTATAIDGAESKKALNDLVAVNKDKFAQMRAGGNPDDIAVADRLSSLYRAKLATFADVKDQPKPKTVEQAMKEGKQDDGMQY